MANERASDERRERLQAARLYLVTDSTPPHHDPAGLVREAAAGGVDVVQLRDKRLDDDELAAVAHALRALCERLGVLLIVNDRPAVAAEVGADGVHVGQDDTPVEGVREIVGERLLVGLSTHAPEEIDAAAPELVDYIGVGPVHETPTKPGRPAVGTELVRYAASSSRVPFFAIGGLAAGNIGEVLDAGARRVCVLRAIAAAKDPRQAAGEIRGVLEGRGSGR
jgi:thiamine-phosphate pyrophosphorylase